MSIRESAENYLETILLLTRSRVSVRAVDIAAEMSFSKPSVSVAMKKLRGAGFIEVDEEDGNIILTPAGQTEAERVYERHSTLYDWLRGMGVPDGVAAKDACSLEHILSPETYSAIKKLSQTDDYE